MNERYFILWAVKNLELLAMKTVIVKVIQNLFNNFK